MICTVRLSLNSSAASGCGPIEVSRQAASPDISADAATVELTTRMLRGDEAAYQQFFESYFNRLLRYLLVVTRGQEDTAREVLQATFLRVVRHITTFTSEEAFWSWLTVLARSAAVDEQRKRTRYVGLLGRLFLRQQSVTASAPSSTLDLADLLRSNVDLLGAEERELVERKYFRKESVLHIAAALHLTEKAVESRLVRIRRKLKDLILADLNQHE